MTTTTRSLPVQLAELIEAAQSAATGPALDQLRQAYRLALQLGEELALERVTVDRSRAAIGGERDRAEALRGRVRELETELAGIAAEPAPGSRLAAVSQERDQAERKLVELRRVVATAWDPELQLERIRTVLRRTT
jgi:hypothetical protein